jgi:hypothetical protein
VRKYINTNDLVGKKLNQFIDFNILNPPTTSITILLTLNEHDCVPNFHKITNNIFKKLVDMG